MRILLSLLLAAILLTVVAPASGSLGNLQFHCPPYRDPANPSQFYFRQVDPVVSFGVSLSNHLHQFTGNMGVDDLGFTEHTTTQDMLVPGRRSSCFVKSNRSAFWWPVPLAPAGTTVPSGGMTLPDGRVAVGATNFRYYFRNPGGAKMMFPSGGFRQVIGDHDNISDYGSPARWQCTPNGTVQLWMPNENSPNCGGNAGLEETIRDGSTCWDGNRTGPGMGSDDGPANARDQKEPCDAAHPYRLSVIDAVIDFPHAALTAGTRLSSDGMTGRRGLSAHLDDAELFAPQDPVTGMEPQSRILNLCMNNVEGPELGGLPDGYPPMDPNGLSCQEVDDFATGTAVVWVTTRNVPLSQSGPNMDIPPVVH
jgi:hypothetical protein